jgi:pectinesterase
MFCSTGYQKFNTVTFQRNINSATAGNLDASSVLNVVSANFRAYNINFQNTYGSGAQAVAVTANGDLQGFYACGFYGYQVSLLGCLTPCMCIPGPGTLKSLPWAQTNIFTL